MLKVGDPIPELNIPDSNENIITKKKLKGSFAVIYFYPKDQTPGCTKEACNFTDSIDFFDHLKVAIYGISPDSVGTHQKFIQSKKLKINLLADEDAKVSKAFGVYGEKKIFNYRYQGIFRTTFIIDPHNRIAKVFEKVRVKGHVEAVKNALNELMAND